MSVSNLKEVGRVLEKKFFGMTMPSPGGSRSREGRKVESGAQELNGQGKYP